jgi:hypothetical protein
MEYIIFTLKIPNPLVKIENSSKGQGSCYFFQECLSVCPLGHFVNVSVQSVSVSYNTFNIIFFYWPESPLALA